MDGLDHEDRGEVLNYRRFAFRQSRDEATFKTVLRAGAFAGSPQIQNSGCAALLAL